MDDAGMTSKLEKPAPIAANGLEALSLTVGDTLDRTSATFNTGLRHWQAECLRFVDEATADGQAAFTRLWQSKTPLDVLSAEHEWLRARTRSVLEAGVRLVDAFAATPRVTKGDSVERVEPLRRKRQSAT
jgi:hypothetical protein